jgi:hypothetical protein
MTKLRLALLGCCLAFGQFRLSIIERGGILFHVAGSIPNPVEHFISHGLSDTKASFKPNRQLIQEIRPVVDGHCPFFS